MLLMNSLRPIHCAGVHLIYHPAINQGITSTCAFKLYMNLMAFKLVYGLMHLTNFNNFSAQTSYKPYLPVIKKNIFFSVSPFLGRLWKFIGLQLSFASSNPNEIPRVLLK